MKFLPARVFCCLLMALPFASTAQEQDTGFTVPKWEFGLAAAALRVPAYPSSASTSERRFLVPWFVYRGDKVRLQDGGVKLIAVENSRVTIDLSLAASLNASSEDAPLRAGMPALDYLLEVGPKIDVRLLDESLANNQRRRLNWATALRAAVSTDFKSLDDRGVVLGSQLKYRHSGLANDKTSLSVSLNLTWSGEPLMDYLYEVDSAYEAPDRPQYDASAGFVGANVSIGLGHRIHKNWNTYISVVSTLHGGSANSDSPLFERNNTVGIFGGISVKIKESRDSIRVMDN